SGFTYFVTADSGEYVLRLPPPNARIAGTADVMRQGRIMAALHDAGLPAPAVPIISDEPVVDGRPFILMERVSGRRIEKTALEETAVLDWEIAELGQPLLDLGCLCAMTVRRQFPGAPSPGGAVALDLHELFMLYGVDEREMRWYIALSLYKYAAILGYNLMLHR